MSSKGVSEYSSLAISSSDIPSFPDIPSFGRVPNEHFVSKIIPDKASFLMYLQFWPGPKVDGISGIECSCIFAARLLARPLLDRMVAPLESSNRITFLSIAAVGELGSFCSPFPFPRFHKWGKKLV